MAPSRIASDPQAVQAGSDKSERLLAVDVGLQTGLAMFAEPAHLLWYRSQHLADPIKLKKLIRGLLREPPRPNHLFLEGGGRLADLWQREAQHLGIVVHEVQAEDWRRRLFYARQRGRRALAKQEADKLARQVITACGGKQPTSLRHDAAEAILTGFYGLLKLGWIDGWPDGSRLFSS